MSSLKIKLDNSKMLDSSVAISIGFVGTGSFSKEDGTPLKTIGEGYGGSHFKGNWYPYSEVASGITTSGFSGRIYVCYGTPWQPTSATSQPAFLPGTGDNANCVFDKVELTFDGSPYSCADLTSIDFWAIPMNLVSYLDNVKVHELKGVKDSSSISEIYSVLKAQSNPVQSTDTATELYKACEAEGMNPPTLSPESGEMTYNETFLRIVGPNSYPSFGNPGRKEMMGLPFTPYNTMEAYLNHLIDKYGPGTKKGAVVDGLGNGVIGKVAGTFSGNPSASPQTNLTKKQSYNFTIEIDKDMNLSLSGKAEEAGKFTMNIKKWDLLTPSAMYGGAPKFDVGETSQTPGNDLYGWMLGDLFAGFNIGAIGCPTSVNNTVVGTMTSSEWFSELDNSQMFGALWPDHSNFYNEWAAALVTRSDAYCFAYAERFSAPQLNLAPGKVDTMKIELLGPVAVDS